jgi:PilZ domain
MRKIKAKKIVRDIRARVSDFELMSKYELSLEQLEKVLGRLVEAGTIREDEIKERGPFFDNPDNRSKTRRFPRTYLRIPLEIEDLNDSANKGLLIDLSDDGFRTRGIAAAVGEEKVLLVSLKEVRKRTVRLRATCLWAKQDVDAKVLQEAGFKIVHISESDLIEIRRVAGLLSLGDRNLSRKR